MEVVVILKMVFFYMHDHSKNKLNNFEEILTAFMEKSKGSNLNKDKSSIPYLERFFYHTKPRSTIEV